MFGEGTEVNSPHWFCVHYKYYDVNPDHEYDLPWSYYDKEMDEYFNRLDSKTKTPPVEFYFVDTEGRDRWDGWRD